METSLNSKSGWSNIVCVFSYAQSPLPVDLVLASVDARWSRVVLSQKTAVSHVCIIISASKKRRGGKKEKSANREAPPLPQMNSRQV